MSGVLTAEKIVPISNFNKGGAAKIFEEVKKAALNMFLKIIFPNVF